MDSTIRPSWPSADLWRRLAAETLTDETKCPACQCPAAVHQRDPMIGVWFCPDAPTAEQKARLWAMVKKAPKMPNPFEAARNAGMAGIVRETAQAELRQARAETPDFDQIEAYIRRVMARNGNLTIMQAIPIARELKREDQLRSLEWSENKTRVTPPGRRQYAPPPRLKPNPTLEDEDRAVAARAAQVEEKARKRSEPATAIRKRRYNFDED